ncbi:hypothetical protein T5B8_12748 [Salinisphaera sp. T5B8]
MAVLERVDGIQSDAWIQMGQNVSILFVIRKAHLKRNRKQASSPLKRFQTWKKYIDQRSYFRYFAIGFLIPRGKTILKP